MLHYQQGFAFEEYVCLLVLNLPQFSDKMKGASECGDFWALAVLSANCW